MTDQTNDQPRDLEGVLRRVQKLLAIANDERANPAEAAAAASQAEKIMRHYQIEHADVIEASLARDDSFDEQDVGATMNPDAHAKSTTTWAGMLSLAIARLNDCRASWVRTQRLGVTLRYSGYKSDTQVALWTHLYVVNQMGQALRTFQRDTDATRTQSESFRKGFVVAVVNSIEAAIKVKHAEMMAASASRALVVTKAGAVDERFGEQKRKSSRFSTDKDGYDSGVREGSKLDLGRRAMGGSASSQQRLGA